MSVHRMSAAGGFQYLLRHTATGDAPRGQLSLVDYYTESGNPAGQWMGSGLAGLAGGDRVRPGSVVTEAAMTAIFGQGVDPISREPLGRAFPTRTGSDGLTRPAGVAGYDLTFTPVKSTSVLWGLGDPATRAAVAAAHHAAVEQTMTVFESRVAATRVGYGGATRVAVRGVVAAAFDHPDTRHGDPNLHTHVVVANRVQADDGVWRTLDGQQLFAAGVALSETYDALVSDELSRRLPVAFGWRDRGARRTPAFEVDGIDDQLLALFSTRSRDVDTHLQGLLVDFHASRGRGPNRVETIRLRQTATLATRPVKQAHAWSDLLTSWGQRAREATGREPRDLLAGALDGSYARALRASDIGSESRRDLAALAVVGVQSRRATWNGWNLEAEVARLTKSVTMASATDRAELHASLVALAQACCVPLDGRRDGPVEVHASPNATGNDPRFESIDRDPWSAAARRWTSATVLDAETRLLAAATTGAGPAVADGFIARVADALTAAEGPPRSLTDRGFRSLAPDQAAALVQVCTAGRAVQVLVGPAGTGKTTTLKAISGAWNLDPERATYSGGVVGLAPSAAAAAELSQALGTRCETTAKWLHETVGPAGQQRLSLIAELTARIDGTQVPGQSRYALQQSRHRLIMEQKQWTLQAGQLLVVDEATLAGTLELDHLVTQAQTVGAGVLLVGDHHQLSAVQAGGAFGLLARRTSTAELSGLWRFTHRWEAETTRLLRTGNPTAIDHYDAHHRVHDGDRDAMLTAAYAAWRTDTDHGRDSLLIAADNETVRQLNAAARTDNVLTGRATAAGVELWDGTSAGIGDLVTTRRNDRTLPHGDGEHVRNGENWTVTAIHPDRSLNVTSASAADSEGHEVRRLPAEYVAEHVELGYAITAHRAQSRTVDTSHVVTGPGMDREHLYVAITRGRDANHTYVPLDLLDGDEPHQQLDLEEPPRTGREVLVGILATTGAELSATESLTRSREPQPVDALRRPQFDTNRLRQSDPTVPDGRGLTR
ncbi:MAG: MobF family relaxase [Sporichthyaceae bacterium]